MKKVLDKRRLLTSIVEEISESDLETNVNTSNQLYGIKSENGQENQNHDEEMRNVTITKKKFNNTNDNDIVKVEKQKHLSNDPEETPRMGLDSSEIPTDQCFSQPQYASGCVRLQPQYANGNTLSPGYRNCICSQKQNIYQIDDDRCSQNIGNYIPRPNENKYTRILYKGSECNSLKSSFIPYEGSEFNSARSSSTPCKGMDLSSPEKPTIVYLRRGSAAPCGDWDETVLVENQETVPCRNRKGPQNFPCGARQVAAVAVAVCVLTLVLRYDLLAYSGRDIAFWRGYAWGVSETKTGFLRGASETRAGVLKGESKTWAGVLNMKGSDILEREKLEGTFGGKAETLGRAAVEPGKLGRVFMNGPKLSKQEELRDELLKTKKPRRAYFVGRGQVIEIGKVSLKRPQILEQAKLEGKFVGRADFLKPHRAYLVGRGHVIEMGKVFVNQLQISKRDKLSSQIVSDRNYLQSILRKVWNQSPSANIKKSYRLHTAEAAKPAGSDNYSPRSMKYPGYKSRVTATHMVILILNILEHYTYIKT